MARPSALVFLCAVSTSAGLAGCGSGEPATSADPYSGATTAASSGSGGDATSGAGGQGGAGEQGGASATSGSGGAAGTGGSGEGGATTGAGGESAGAGGGGSAPLLFDMPMIQDAATAQCTFTNQHTVLDGTTLLDVWNVSFISWESIDGTLQPILIRGYAARPSGENANLPGVVGAHGLGGYAEESHATGLASLLGAFVIAYTGPGGGTEPDNTSEGRPSGYDSGRRMFDTLPDTRGSWFWGHAVAGMRALTCVEARPEIDKTRLGMTGFSAGGVVTLISASVDSRIKAAVPLSGTHAWSTAVQSPHAWQHGLLTAAGMTTDSPGWIKLQTELIEPAAMVAHTSSKVLMVDGSTDEFFPLTAFNATYAAIPGDDKRASIAGNFDHGCYILTGGESALTIEARANLHAEGGQRMWFGHWFGTNPDYAYLPSAPSVTLTPAGAATVVAATVDGGGAALDVEEVKIWWSNDDAFLWGNVALAPAGGGVYGGLVGFPVLPNTAYYVDVVYKTKSFLAPQRFALSSMPALPGGFVPHIRDIQTCL